MVFAFHGIGKKYGEITALEDISFAAEAADIVSIIGASGAGKTTLLKILAGLETQDTGTLELTHDNVDTHPRILVFQDYILFPHMSVFENVAFGLRARRRQSRPEIREAVNQMLEYFGIADQASKYPQALSGGQRQRVAIARSMILKPHILLLDEPFANLDKNLKMETAEFIRQTQKRFQVTTVAVTHDLEEAFAISDKIGILLDGKLVQYDTTENIYFSPATPEAARFLGPVNLISGEVLRSVLPGVPAAGPEKELLARAENFSIIASDSGNGKITTRRFTGRAILYGVTVLGKTLEIYSLSNGLEPGDRVEVRLIPHDERIHHD